MSDLSDIEREVLGCQVPLFEINDEEGGCLKLYASGRYERRGAFENIPIVTTVNRIPVLERAAKKRPR